MKLNVAILLLLPLLRNTLAEKEREIDLSNVEGTDVIVGGKPATPGAWKFMVALMAPIPPQMHRNGTARNWYPLPTNPYPQPTNPYPQPTNPYPQPTNPYPQPTNPYPQPTYPYPPVQPSRPYPPQPSRPHPGQSKLMQMCGGSLIDRSWVLTAAHCLQGMTASKLTIRVGEYHLEQTGEHGLQHKDYKVAQLYSYPKFNMQTMIGDLALIKLASPVNLSPGHIDTIGLPQSGHEVRPGTLCDIIGWGKVSHPGNASPVLMHLRIDIVDRPTCQRYLEAAFNRRTEIGSDKICGGSKRNEGSCQGDSGGPLICSVNGRQTVVGATSFGNPCAKGQPTVYANIGDRELRRWVRKISGI